MFAQENVADGTEVVIATLPGIQGKTRKVTGVNTEVKDELFLRVWLNQLKVFEQNTAHLLNVYGSASLYRAEVDLDIELVQGSELKVSLYNNSGGAVNPAQVSINYDEPM
jgi:hypothetical protein